jgi:hypothetical protein
VTKNKAQLGGNRPKVPLPGELERGKDLWIMCLGGRGAAGRVGIDPG